MTFIFNINESLKPYFKDVEPILEDPESSQQMWEAKKQPVYTEQYSPKLLTEMLENTSRVFSGIESFPWYKKSKIIHSVKHLTLPEALIYNEILNNKYVNNFSVSLRFKYKKDQKICFELKSDEFIYNILYHPIELNITLLKQNKNFGKLKYVIRNRKLEEIIGVINSEKIILDPVWNPKNKNKLKEEFLTIGKNRMSISYNKNEKHAFILKNNKKMTFKSKLASKNYKDKNRKMVSKDFLFSTFKGSSTIIFTPGILIPIFGDWLFKTTNS